MSIDELYIEIEKAFGFNHDRDIIESRITRNN